MLSLLSQQDHNRRKKIPMEGTCLALVGMDPPKVGHSCLAHTTHHLPRRKNGPAEIYVRKAGWLSLEVSLFLASSFFLLLFYSILCVKGGGRLDALPPLTKEK